jgi:hypothetical protein
LWSGIGELNLLHTATLHVRNMSHSTRFVRKTRHWSVEPDKRDAGPSFTTSLLSWYARQKAQSRDSNPADRNGSNDQKQP